MKIYIQCFIAAAVAPLVLARIRGSDSDAREIEQINNTLRLDRNLGIGFIDNVDDSSNAEIDGEGGDDADVEEPMDEVKLPGPDKNGKSMKDGGAGKAGKSDKSMNSKKEKEEKSKSGKAELFEPKSGKAEKSKSGKSEKEKKAKGESTNTSKKMVKGDTVVKKDKADPSPKEDKASSR